MVTSLRDSDRGILSKIPGKEMEKIENNEKLRQIGIDRKKKFIKSTDGKCIKKSKKKK